MKYDNYIIIHLSTQYQPCIKLLLGGGSIVKYPVKLKNK